MWIITIWPMPGRSVGAFEAHPCTGAIQIVEVRERAEEVAPAPSFDFVFPETPVAEAPRTLFAGLDDNALLSICVPMDWLADVRAANDDGFFALAVHLPAEAAEALLEFATSGRPRPIPSRIPMPCGASG